MSFVFWDTETTGINSAFDQILQLAAIRTDDDLNEIDRFEVRSRLLPYVLPSPGALRVTGLTIDDLLDEAHPSHYEMVCRIQSAFGSWCPSVFIGYNSLRFDEEFLRQAFYQCLHAPYVTNTGGSKRADALALVQTAALLHPNSIAVPLNEKGKPTFKLDRLAPANSFEHANAHDALADVEATIFMCKLVKDRCPAVWERAVRFASKDTVSSFVDDADAFVLIEPTRQAAKVVTALGTHPAQGNLTYCWNLEIDPRPYHGLDDAELVRELGKSGSPLRKLKKNAAPPLCSLDDAPSHIVAEDQRELFEKRGRWVVADRAFVARVIAAAVKLEKEYPPSPHVERQIYNGFWSAADSRRITAFHQADWTERGAIADQIEDARLSWLARRLIWVERPDLCSEGNAGALSREKAMRLLAGDADCGGWNTISKTLSELEQVIGEASAAQVVSFERLRNYVEMRRADCIAQTQRRN